MLLYQNHILQRWHGVLQYGLTVVNLKAVQTGRQKGHERFHWAGLRSRPADFRGV
jgi:hypothetical protein